MGTPLRVEVIADNPNKQFACVWAILAATASTTVGRSVVGLTTQRRSVEYKSVSRSESDSVIHLFKPFALNDRYRVWGIPETQACHYLLRATTHVMNLIAHFFFSMPFARRRWRMDTFRERRMGVRSSHPVGRSSRFYFDALMKRRRFVSFELSVKAATGRVKRVYFITAIIAG